MKALSLIYEERMSTFLYSLSILLVRTIGKDPYLSYTILRLNLRSTNYRLLHLHQNPHHPHDNPLQDFLPHLLF